MNVSEQSCSSSWSSGNTKGSDFLYSKASHTTSPDQFCLPTVSLIIYNPIIKLLVAVGMAGQIKQRERSKPEADAVQTSCALGLRSMISNERKFTNNASFVNSISSLPVKLVVTVFTTIRRNMHHQLV